MTKSKSRFILIILTQNYFVGLAGFGLVLLMMAFYVNLKYDRTTVVEMNRGSSADFHGRGIEDRLRVPTTDEMMAIPNTGLAFGTQITSTSPLLSFYYRCRGDCPRIWLNFKQSGIEERILVHHPLFDSLNWFRVPYSGFSLYRKSWPKTPELLEGAILTEKPVSTYFDEEPIKIAYLEEVMALPQDTEVILTTFSPPERNDEWYIFHRKVILPPEFTTDKPVEWRLTYDGGPTAALTVARLKSD